MTQMRSIFFFLFLIRITQLESRQFRKFLRYVNSRGGRKRGGGTKLCAPLPSFFSFSFSSVTLHERVVLINKRRRNKAETSIISIRKYRYFYTFQRIGLLDARHREQRIFLSFLLSFFGEKMTLTRSIFFFLFPIWTTRLESRQSRKFPRYVNSRGGEESGWGEPKLCTRVY